ncbi:MAG: ZIP family metal transporter [Candidatus Omnitrophica bacterium]|nr:ZIP family metal transporter [Candidatus Omnitrophota bacterium]MBU4346218.1 ZIP family metal transporter [Candidatus Omnitrophota bacterium]MBU4473348.1 ZIP family metal transporter [Candidatus Omnitrophota bacterium]MCG2707018.1 ZIP family metal transporter [Candidatus Omnitrophota bacterium]
MNNFFWAVGASIAVSLISLVGILSLLLKDKWLDKILIVLIGFAAGGLIGGAFLHLIPEALERSRDNIIFIYLILGFVFFFILEKYFYWRHCHKGICDIHAFTYLNLFGDGIHNFSDGLIIGASFIVNVHFGIVTTLVIIFHEIPQEIGDFGVLIYGGFSKFKALVFNFISALTCVVGTVIGYFLSTNIGTFSVFLLPFTAGGFIYIAACDLIPELHRQPDLKKSTFSMLAFLCGICFILLARLIHK